MELLQKENSEDVFFIPLFGIFGFLEELSYGQRIFNLKMPRLFGIRIDGIHDFIDITFRLIQHQNNTLRLFFVGVIIFLIILSIILIYNKLEAILKILGDYESLRLASFSAGLIFFALIFDLEFVSLRWSFLKFLEEVFELNAALMLLFASYSIKSSPT